MIVLVCGGRDFRSISSLREKLNTLNEEVSITEIIHGNAKGADIQGGNWANSKGILVKSFPALWDKYGKAAGYRRNVQMLEEGKPDIVVAFVGGKGTKMMCRLAEEAGVEVHRIGWMS